MHWKDEAIILESSPLGEEKVILKLFTHYLGKQTGLVGANNTDRFLMKAGCHVFAHSLARTPESIGLLKTELIQSYPSLWNSYELATTIHCLTHILQLVLPPKDPHPLLFEGTIDFFKTLVQWPLTLAFYCKWELLLLKELGFGLNLSHCAVTHETSNLTYVSPRSGCAVSKTAGLPYKDKLLALPHFLTHNHSILTISELKKGLFLTGYFLEQKLFPQLGKPYPAIREKLFNLL